MKIDLEDHNVEIVEITLEQARNDELDLIPLLEESLDQAQAHVFGGDYKVAYVVIRIGGDAEK